MKSYWPAFGIPLTQFTSIIDLDEQAIRARYAAAFLLRHQSTIPTVGLKRTASWEDRQETNSIVAMVMPLRARPTSDTGLISIGRLDGNDIAINDVTVSKYHAFIRESAEHAFFVQDAGSKNGTLLEDKVVPARGHGPPTALASGQVLHFGSVSTTFLSVASFFDLVRLTRPTSSGSAASLR